MRKKGFENLNDDIIAKNLLRQLLLIPPPSQLWLALKLWLTAARREEKGRRGVEAGNGCCCFCVFHPHVCLIVPAVTVETEVWQRARWVIRLSPCALKVTALLHFHRLFIYTQPYEDPPGGAVWSSDQGPDDLQLLQTSDQEQREWTLGSGCFQLVWSDVSCSALLQRNLTTAS